MAHGDPRTHQEYFTYVEATDFADVISMLDDTQFKAGEGQLNYPPTSGKHNFVIQVTIEQLLES